MNVSRSSNLLAMMLLSTVVTLSSAHAANRAFPGSMGKAANPSEEHCLSFGLGWLTNQGPGVAGCPQDLNVLLPVSVDNAAWYYLTVYGYSSPYGRVTCEPVAVSSTGSYSPGTSGSFVRNNWTGEKLILQARPVYNPGDALYIHCTVGVYTAIFSYGWN